jgi:hypothetical protein
MLPLPHKIREEAKNEVYQFIDKFYRKLNKKSDGTVNEFDDGFQDNDIDALRHAYVSGVFAQFYSESFAEFLGNMQEIFPGYGASSPTGEKQKNMDLWNNRVGRKYGLKTKSREELFLKLLEALKAKELIIDPSDSRKYEDNYNSKLDSNFPVIVAKESATGENLIFYDTSKNIFMNKTDFVEIIKKGQYKNYELRVIGGKETPFSKKDRRPNNNLG